MVATPSRWTRRVPWLRRAGRPLAVALAVLALAASPAAAQKAEDRADGLFLPVPGVIDSKAVDAIKTKVEDALKRQPNLATVIFDFNPDNQPTASGDFGTCGNLTRFIRKLRANHPAMTTVAFVHEEVARHTVLPVLACQDLIMSKGAKLGEVLRDHEGELSEEEIAAYEGVARFRPSPDLVWKMVYPYLVLRQVNTKVGPRYVDQRTLEAKTPKDQKKLEELTQKWGPLDPVKGIPPGLESGKDNTRFTSARAREYGLCKAIYETGADVVRAYNLPPHTLHEHFLLGRTRVGWRIDLTSTVSKAKLDSLERRIKAAVGRGANVILLYLDCEGGETDDVASTARWLSNLKDDAGVLPVLTIAYVPPRRSLGAATFLALGCSQIVMGKDAVLADFDYLKNAGNTRDSARVMLTKLAEDRGYPAALFRASLQPDLVVYQARDKQHRYAVLTKEELADQGDRWEEKARIEVPPGETLKIGTDLARKWRIARWTDVNTDDDLYRRAELDPARVRVSRDDWLDQVAEFFRQEIVKVFLIMIGIAGLILELKLPGAGLPGIVAAICFVLFFWAHSFVGQFTMLAVFLFLLGVVLIGLEIFVLPGFGITGISGIALVIGSLILVTLERMPETSQDWAHLGVTVTTLGVSLVAAIAGACVVAWYLPHIPYASRLVLQPPTEGEEGVDADTLRRSDAAAALLGAIGVAATTLRPAGKARFGDEYLDVIAEGDYVNPGSRVQVIEIEGNRIVVKEV